MTTLIPTAVIVFNRYYELTRVVDALLDCPTSNITFFFDGPKCSSDKKVQTAMKMYIKKSLEKRISYKIRVRDKNLGLRRNMLTSLNEFFTNNEFGVVIEDDCIPAPEFYAFLKLINLKYKNDTNIFCATGTRFPTFVTPEKSIFSRYFRSWGWATWNDRWFDFSNNFENLLSSELDFFIDNVKVYERKHYKSVFKALHEGQIQSWAYLVQLKMFVDRTYCVVPSTNYIQNIGFGQKATNTVNLNLSHFSVPLVQNSNRNFTINTKPSKFFSFIYDWQVFMQVNLNIHSIRDLLYVIKN